MEFIFGDKGHGYSIIYGNGSVREKSISEYVQKNTFFDISLQTKTYFYKVISAGKDSEFNAISCCYNQDKDFTRGVYYNHVVYNKIHRSYFTTKDFTDSFLAPFAEYEDVKAYKDTEKFAVAARALPSFQKPNADLVKRILYGVYSGKKTVVVLNEDPAVAFDIKARWLLAEVYKYLDVSLRIKTSWAVNCNTKTFETSGFQICVISSALNVQKSKSAIWISEDEEHAVNQDRVSDLIDYLMGLDGSEREKLFADYDSALGCADSSFSIDNFEIFRDALKNKDVTELTECLIRAVSNSGGKVSFSPELLDMLVKHHSKETGYVIKGLDKIDLMNLDSFIDKNYECIQYLICVYGDEDIPELQYAASAVVIPSVTETLLKEKKQYTEKLDYYYKKMCDSPATEKRVYAYLVPSLAKIVSNILYVGNKFESQYYHCKAQLAGAEDNDELMRIKNRVICETEAYFKTGIGINNEISIVPQIEKVYQEELLRLQKRADEKAKQVRACENCDKFFIIPMEYLKNVVLHKIPNDLPSTLYGKYEIRSGSEKDTSVLAMIFETNFEENVKLNNAAGTLVDMAMLILNGKFKDKRLAGTLCTDTFMNYVVYQLLEYQGSDMIGIRNKFLQWYKNHVSNNSFANNALLDIALACNMDELNTALNASAHLITKKRKLEEELDIEDVYRAVYLSFMLMVKCEPELKNKLDTYAKEVTAYAIDEEVLKGFAYHIEVNGDDDAIEDKAKKKAVKNAKSYLCGSKNVLGKK